MGNYLHRKIGRPQLTIELSLSQPKPIAMGLGVLEPRETVVQGTVQLFDNIDLSELQQTTVLLKHTKDGKIVLSPQPSDDPCDPLNWPWWRRNLSYGMIVLMVFLALAHTPALAPMTIELAEQYQVSVADVARLTSYISIVVGPFAYVASVFSRMFGKRALFIFGAIIFVASDIWAARAKSYNSLLGARLLSGIPQAIFEANGMGCVADLFFVHERGTRVTIFIFAFQSGVSIAVPISTQIMVRYGLKWCFGAFAITEGILAIGFIFFFPECSWKREHVVVLAHQNEDEILAQTHETSDKAVATEAIEDAILAPQIYQKGSYIRTLKLFNGWHSQERIWTLAYRAVVLTFHPTIFWGAAVSLALSWTAGLAWTIALSMTAPPWNFSPNGVSNMFIAGWIGTLLSSIVGATLDPIIEWMSKKNKNIFEPEFRLVHLVPGLILFLIGWIGWGWGIHVHMSWYGLAILFAVQYLGCCLLNSACISYIIDAHLTLAVESQVVVFAMKNLYVYGMGYFFVDWYIADGPKHVFGASGGVIAGVTLLAIPYYMFGKRLRAFWTRHPFLGVKETNP